MRIKTRLLLLLIPAIVISLGLLSAHSYINANAQARKLAQAEAQGIALEQSNLIFNKLLQAEAAASSLAAGLVNLSKAENKSREAMSMMVKGATESSADYFGVWVLWAPNAFDGKDAEYIGNEEVGNSLGRANAYWLRKNRSIEYDPSEDYDHEPYYTDPMAARRLTIIPPYRDMDTEGKVLMSTIAMPLMDGGRALGAVGIDIELEFIQGLLKAIRPYETGYAMLVSDSGAILADPRDGQPLGADLPQVDSEVRDLMRAGKAFSITQKSVLDDTSVRCFYTPVKLESFAAPWYFVVALPMDKVMAESNRTLFVQLGISLVALALLVGLVFYTAASVSGPLRRIAAYAQQVASGNYKTPVDSKGFALELVDLQRSLRSMLTSLLDGMRQVEERGEHARQETERAHAATVEAERARQATEANHRAMQEVAGRVDAVSQKLQQTAHELNDKIAGAGRETHEQNNLMGETVVAISAMSESIVRVSSNAGDAADFAARTRDRARQGADIVDKTIEAFTGIHRETATLGGQIEDLSRRTESIGGILDMINDIADQTNLLALNAAIEAARAGDAGRGFAVVADEVRKLAEKTMQATRQVEESVNGIRNSMRVSAEGILRTVGTVQSTVELGREAQSSLADIVALVQAMDKQVHDIAGLCLEQTATSDQVASIVDRLRQLSLIVGEAMDESAFITRTLEPQARELGLLVDELSKK